ncbi:MAG: PocR ligand-binding domain-containing protein [Clostridia bacterium]
MKNSEDRIQRDKEIEAIESYALSTGIYTKLVDSNGEVIASAGRPCEYCRFCAEHQPDKDFRSKTYRYGSMQAQRFGGKYIYFCPMGLTNWASPIMKDGILVGALTAGPVMMFDMEEYIEFDLALRLKLEKQTKEQVRTLLQQLPFMEPKRVTGLAEQLFYTAAYVRGRYDDYWMPDNQQNQSDISDTFNASRISRRGSDRRSIRLKKKRNSWPTLRMETTRMRREFSMKSWGIFCFTPEEPGRDQGAGVGTGDRAIPRRDGERRRCGDDLRLEPAVCE